MVFVPKIVLILRRESRIARVPKVSEVAKFSPNCPVYLDRIANGLFQLRILEAKPIFPIFSAADPKLKDRQKPLFTVRAERFLQNEERVGHLLLQDLHVTGPDAAFGDVFAPLCEHFRSSGRERQAHFLGEDASGIRRRVPLGEDRPVPRSGKCRSFGSILDGCVFSGRIFSGRIFSGRIFSRRIFSRRIFSRRIFSRRVFSGRVLLSGVPAQLLQLGDGAVSGRLWTSEVP